MQPAGRRRPPLRCRPAGLGKTGLEVPILGCGTGPGGMGLRDGDAIDLFHRAIDLGVTYPDTAPGYDRAHLQMRAVLAERRDEVIVATKTPVSTAREALDSLAQSLRDLGTDHVDIAFVHNLGSRDAEQVFGSDGALAGLQQAKRAGMARFIGFTSHCRPEQSARALAEHEVDAIMVPVNYGDRHTYGFERQVLPVAHRRDVGIAAMKVYGGASAMRYDAPRPAALTAKGPVDHEPAMRWALDQAGVAIAVIGVLQPGGAGAERALGTPRAAADGRRAADARRRGQGAGRVLGRALRAAVAAWFCAVLHGDRQVVVSESANRNYWTGGAPRTGFSLAVLVRGCALAGIVPQQILHAAHRRQQAGALHRAVAGNGWLADRTVIAVSLSGSFFPGVDTVSSRIRGSRSNRDTALPEPPRFAPYSRDDPAAGTRKRCVVRR